MLEIRFLDAPGDSPPVDGPGGNSLGVPPTDRNGAGENDSEVDAADSSDDGADDDAPVDGPGGNSLGVPPTDQGVSEDDSEIDATDASDSATAGDDPAEDTQDSGAPSVDPEPVIVTPAIGLNVRSGPSVDEPKLGAFTEGTILEPTGNEEQDNAANPWIEIDGTTFLGEDVIGWVAGQYVEPASDDPVFAEPVSVTAESGLNIRSGPSVEQPKLGVFTEGAVLQPTGSGATDSKGAPWIEVTGTTSSGDDVSGWIAADYVGSTAGHLPNVR